MKVIERENIIRRRSSERMGVLAAALLGLGMTIGWGLEFIKLFDVVERARVMAGTRRSLEQYIGNINTEGTKPYFNPDFPEYYVGGPYPTTPNYDNTPRTSGEWIENNATGQIDFQIKK